jgi:3-dehydroquinate dehydratase/shikimate dehydrogenase
MIIGVSIAPPSMSEALTLLRSMRNRPEPVEVRTDSIRDLNLEVLLRQPRPSVIVTHRIQRDGGRFAGTQREHLNVLADAARLGAEFVDIELSCGKNAVASLCSRRKKSGVIVSYHNFERTPSNLDAIYDKLKASPADIMKVAVTANDITDSVSVIDLMKRARRERKRLIAIAMGERGQMTRILGAKYGGYLTFASVGPGAQTANGQYSRDELRDIFHVRTINSHTHLFGLVGNPVSQSKGIYFHNQIFRKRHANAVYVNFLVDDLRSFLSAFWDDFSGLSITMPFKQKIVDYLDGYSEDVKELRVVNTVIRKRNKLIGYNTDLSAIISLLKQATSLRGKHIVVIGTGAIARTSAYATSISGAHLTVAGRSYERARPVAGAYGGNWAHLDDVVDLRPDILINATSVGMTPSHDDMPVPRRALRNRMIVFDVVRSPGQTLFVRTARAAGCTTITGDDLFQRQAHLQSKLFIDSIS